MIKVIRIMIKIVVVLDFIWAAQIAIINWIIICKKAGSRKRYWGMGARFKIINKRYKRHNKIGKPNAVTGVQIKINKIGWLVILNLAMVFEGVCLLALCSPMFCLRFAAARCLLPQTSFIVGKFASEFLWCARRESNARPLAPQANTLSIWATGTWCRENFPMPQQAALI